MPRRTYRDLGYIVFRSRHVLPSDMVDTIDRMALRVGVDRTTMLEIIVSRWLGVQSVLMPPDQDPDYFAVTDEAALLPVRQ